MKAPVRTILVTASVGLTVFLLGGCAPINVTTQKPDIMGGIRKNLPAVDRTFSLIDMQQVGLAYGECVDAGAGPPKSAKDLLVNLKGDPKYKEAFEKGDIIIAWGADPRRLPPETIIGYQKRPMDDGRMIVLLGAGGTPTPKAMAKDKFDAAPKAKGLK